MECKQRDKKKNSKKIKKNSRNQKHCNKNKECFLWALVDWTWLREKKITECEDMQIKVSQTENRRGKKIERNGTEYPRTVKQLQKL